MGSDNPPPVSHTFEDLELGEKLTIPTDAIIKLLLSHKALREKANKLKNDNSKFKQNLDKVELLLSKFKDYCKKYSKSKDIDSIFEHAIQVTNKALRKSDENTQEDDAASISETLEEYIWLVEATEKDKEYQAQQLEFSDIESDSGEQIRSEFSDVESQYEDRVDCPSKADSLRKIKSEQTPPNKLSRPATPGLGCDNGEQPQEDKPATSDLHELGESIFKRERMFERQPRNYCISYTKITDHKTEIHVKAPEPLKKDNEKSEYPEESDNRLEASDERPHKSQRSEEDEKHPESSDEDPHKPQLDREGIENLASFINRNAEPAMQYRVYSRQHRTGNKKSRGKKHHRAPTPREIHFSHLPPYVSAQEVSSMVRGGPVLFLSVTMEKEFSEARIIFAFGAHATQYLKWVHSAPVTLHSDPFCITSKIAPETDNVIHRAMIRENARRVLIFDPFISAGKEINPDVLWDLIMGCSFESNPIESIGISSDRTGLKVVLRSIAEAIYIKEALNKLGYGSKFGRDETEGTIDELPLNRNFGEWFEKERDFTKDSL